MRNRYLHILSHRKAKPRNHTIRHYSLENTSLGVKKARAPFYLSDEVVSISTLNFSMEATSFAILCFSAEAGREKESFRIQAS